MAYFDHDYKKYPELTNTELQVLQFTSPHVQITEDFDAEVVKVHDGDTITLRTDFRDFDFPLRFLGIDAPEMNAGGEETRDWLINRIDGQKIKVLINKKNRVGKYGRLLGKVFYGGVDIGAEEMNLGLATSFENRREGELPNVDKMFSLKQWL